MRKLKISQSQRQRLPSHIKRKLLPNWKFLNKMFPKKTKDQRANRKFMIKKRLKKANLSKKEKLK
jgi:hypothetical protein